MINSVLHHHSPYLAGLTVLMLMAVCMPVLAEGDKVEWRNTIEEATKQSAETGKPIMMDFYTDW